MSRRERLRFLAARPQMVTPGEKRSLCMGDKDEDVAVGIVDEKGRTVLDERDFEGLKARGGLLDIVDGEEHAEGGIAWDKTDGLGGAGEPKPGDGFRREADVRYGTEILG